MRKKVAIVTSGYLPLPPVEGGAVEALVQMIAEENELYNHINLTIFSVYNKKAEDEAENIKNTNYVFFRIPGFIRVLDLFIYWICKNILRKKKNMSYRYILQRLYYIHAVAKNIHKYNYDELIFENHPTLLYALKKFNNFNKYKGKYDYHAHNEITNEFGHHRYLIEVNKFICVSEFIANSLSEKLGLNNKDKFIVLRNKVDEQRFRCVTNKAIDSFVSKYNIPRNYTLFTFSGRLNPEKGVKELLLAYKNAKLSNAKLIIAGGYFFGSNLKSDYEKELAKIAKEISNDIIFTGNISYDEMPCLYAISDVVVLPSIWNDPAPLTVIESITAGKPLITTYSGGIPEYVNSSDAIILPINDKLVNNLTTSMKLLADDKKTREDLEKAAKVESKSWTKRSFYDDFVDIIN